MIETAHVVLSKEHIRTLRERINRIQMIQLFEITSTTGVLHRLNKIKFFLNIRNPQILTCILNRVPLNTN